MDFVESVQKQIILLREGLVREVLDHFFAEQGLMYSNGVLFGTGRKQCKQRQEPFLAAASNVCADIKEVSVDADKQLCAFRNRSKFDGPDGVERHIDGLHVQQWQDGLIGCEWYFNGEPMEELLEAGILSNPALIFEHTAQKV